MKTFGEYKGKSAMQKPRRPKTYKKRESQNSKNPKGKAIGKG